jgi:gamma-glutamylcyclotransferase (GGCT)/AIG2-like uncharacterized protein YtfP
MKAVTGRLYKGTPAKLPGYAMYRVKNVEYPGIIRDSGSHTVGILYSGLSEEDLEVLDAFEGALYRRALVEVIPEDGSACKAWVYLIPGDLKDNLTDEPWHLEVFMEKGFKRFMKGYVHGRSEVYAGKQKG